MVIRCRRSRRECLVFYGSVARPVAVRELEKDSVYVAWRLCCRGGRGLDEEKVAQLPREGDFAVRLKSLGDI